MIFNVNVKLAKCVSAFHLKLSTNHLGSMCNPAITKLDEVAIIEWPFHRWIACFIVGA